MERVRRVWGAALVAALVTGGAIDVAAAAVAGDERLTKKQWIKAANRICRETDDLIDGLDTPTGDPREELTPEQFAEIADYTDAALEYSEAALADLRDLRPPAKDTRKVKKILRALTGGVAAIEATGDAARDEDRAGTQAALEEAADLGDDFAAASKAYGSTCGSPT
jgi:hypothetical protein